ncbi:MAG: phytanoyl-CoA dioxygenase [Gemmataceae bacterium]|nr:phytanoyl-CoA dioxygenase [Gemmataceae bacterium]
MSNEMNTSQLLWIASLVVDGYVLLPRILSGEVVDRIVIDLDEIFRQDATESVLRTDSGEIYGARNLLQNAPTFLRDLLGIASLWAEVEAILGPTCGLVRVLFFDKPPEQSWALPWHRDRTIAVRDNRLPSVEFTKPTTKVSVPHVEAPSWLLEQMLTLRVHLDPMTDANGPLKVLPSSHRGVEDRPVVTILGERGDVLLMRPLVSHCSNRSADDTTQRRRILHFEFAAIEQLPDGYAWHDYVTRNR